MMIIITTNSGMLLLLFPFITSHLGNANFIQMRRAGSSLQFLSRRIEFICTITLLRAHCIKKKTRAAAKMHLFYASEIKTRAKVLQRDMKMLNR